jgi:MarR family transcriptional regulator, negative regulator of the multidrug operon emrRAB
MSETCEIWWLTCWRISQGDSQRCFMNNRQSPLNFDIVQANLTGLAARMSDVPVSAILLCRLITHVAGQFAAMLEQQTRAAGLNEAEFRVLSVLYSQPKGVAHPTDLCLRASQAPANMSRICDALVGRDLISREMSASDRRRMILRMTKKGDALACKLLPNLFGALREAMQDYPEVEQRMMIEQLKSVGGRLGKVADSERLGHI